jgi:hypothetical protein
MSRKPVVLATSLIAAVAFVPTAGAARNHLGGSPQLKAGSSASSATLHFAANAKPSRIIFAGGQKAGTIKKSGTHGSDTTFTVKVTSRNAFRDAAKYTVHFKFGKTDEVRKVKFYAAG